jgi:hypothetical protein
MPSATSPMVTHGGLGHCSRAAVGVSPPLHRCLGEVRDARRGDEAGKCPTALLARRDTPRIDRTGRSFYVTAQGADGGPRGPGHGLRPAFLGVAKPGSWRYALTGSKLGSWTSASTLAGGVKGPFRPRRSSPNAGAVPAPTRSDASGRPCTGDTAPGPAEAPGLPGRRSSRRPPVARRPRSRRPVRPRWRPVPPTATRRGGRELCDQALGRTMRYLRLEALGHRPACGPHDGREKGTTRKERWMEWITRPAVSTNSRGLRFAGLMLAT